MEKSLLKRNKVTLQIQKDVCLTWDTLFEIGLYKYLSTNPKYIWKTVSDGYSSNIRIFTYKKKLLFKHKEILIYNIEDSSCYKKIIQEQDTRILDAVAEATAWISCETEKIKNDVDTFHKMYLEKKVDINTIISAYNSIRKKA